jgi:transcription elongation GreA/GreB family factor
VGKALIGHKVGDVVTIKTPAKTVEYEVQEIEIAFE